MSDLFYTEQKIVTGNFLDQIPSPSVKVLALSWKEPYASLMLHGKIETRKWATKYRGWVLICASKNAYDDNAFTEIAGHKQWTHAIQVLNTVGLYCNETPVQKYNGNAIAIGKLSDCRKMTIDDEDKCFVKFKPELWCHIYSDVMAIQPFDWKGQQGWKTVDSETLNKIVVI